MVGIDLDCGQLLCLLGLHYPRQWSKLLRQRGKFVEFNFFKLIFFYRFVYVAVAGPPTWGNPELPKGEHGFIRLPGCSRVRLREMNSHQTPAKSCLLEINFHFCLSAHLGGHVGEDDLVALEAPLSSRHLDVCLPNLR